MAIVRPAIGGQTFISMSGGLDPAGELLDITHRQGVDGVSVGKLGKDGLTTTHETLRDLPSAASVKTTMDTYKGLIGTLVTVKDELDNDRSNYLVVSVRQIRAFKVVGGSGGIEATPTHMLRAEWQLRATT